MKFQILEKNVRILHTVRKLPDFILLIYIFFSQLINAQSMHITSISNNAVVPSNWYHPVIAWDDTGTYTGSYGITIWTSKQRFTDVANGRKYIVRDTIIHTMLTQSELFICVNRESFTSDTVHVTVDSVPFIDRAIYRLVEPLFNPQQKVLIQTLTMDDSAPNLWGTAERTCVGCHSYCTNTTILNARRGSERRLVSGTTIGSNSVFRGFRLGEFSFVSVAPDGAKALIVLHAASMIETKKTVLEPFDMTYNAGDLAYVNLRDGSCKPLPGGSDSGLVEDMPAWNPTGDTIVFCRYTPNRGVNALNPVQMYTIPFNLGKGGTAIPLLKTQPFDYCYFPKYSPDGKYISFVCGDAGKGYFARQSSTIWIYSRKDKTTHNLACNHKNTMNSWHVWSADSRWLVFSTKRSSNGITQLHLSRITGDGIAHPSFAIVIDSIYKVNLPVLIPTEKPLIGGDDLQHLLKAFFEPNR